MNGSKVQSCSDVGNASLLRFPEGRRSWRATNSHQRNTARRRFWGEQLL